MTVLKKIGKIALQTLPYLLFALSLLLIFGVVFALRSNQTPTVFGYGAAVVKTKSMETTIMTNDMIFFRKVDPDTLSEGDIIIFWKPNASDSITITHRILSITETPSGRLFTTKGDNNNASETWEIGFSEGFVIGKYVGKSSALGWAYSRFYSLLEGTGIQIIYPFIILLFLLIGVMEGKTILKEMAAAKKKQREAEMAAMAAAELERLRSEQKEPPQE
jgi:signal peptidase I